MRRQSYSSLQTLMACEKKYAYRYIEGLVPGGDEAIKLLRGNAFHAVLQAGLLQRGAAAGSLLVRPDSMRVFDGLELGIDWTGSEPTVTAPEFGPEQPLTPSVVIAHVRAWEAAQEGERQEVIVAACGAPLHERLTDLWYRYSAHWRAEDQRQLPLMAEAWWQREAPNGQELQGRIDAVLYDPEMALVIVRDSKTHESWPSEADAVLDLMESQNHMNLWGIAPELQRLTPNGHSGIEGVTGPLLPQAVEYDRIRFKKPTTPKLTQKGLLSRSITDFDGHTYKAWCSTQEVIDAGYEFEQDVYDKAQADPEAWFRRSLKPLSMNAVSAHVTAMAYQARRAAKITTDNAGLSPSKNCGWCDYLKICRAEIIGGKMEGFVPQDFDLTIRKRG